MSDTPTAPKTIANHCVFPGSTRSGIHRKGGAVYAVAYSAINTEIAIAQKD